MTPSASKDFWNAAAKRNAAWHIATGYSSQSETFFESGVREVDEFLAFGGLALHGTETLLEIGCGVGRMTRRFALLAGRVIAADVSGEMLSRARANLAEVGNVDFLEVSGEGDIPLPSASVDAVFSYITMQHVPTVAAQERYFGEAMRVLRPGGWAFLQFRRSSVSARLIDWAGHFAHFVSGHGTLNRAWRGSRMPARALLSHASETVSVEILPHGRRHMWALARKLSS